MSIAYFLSVPAVTSEEIITGLRCFWSGGGLKFGDGLRDEVCHFGIGIVFRARLAYGEV